MGFREIVEKNEIQIHAISEDCFRSYGNVLEHDFFSLITYMEAHTNIPDEGNIYVASDEQMEQIKEHEQFLSNFYGTFAYQIGYCNGRNSTLNGLEYHKSSEINVMVTDGVLLLGHVWEIEQNTYDVSNVKAFYIPKGVSIELFSTTLHFAPCKTTAEGFKTVVILPKETNRPLLEKVEKITQEDILLFARNKWLIAHPERKPLVAAGAHLGIIGENIRIYEQE